MSAAITLRTAFETYYLPDFDGSKRTIEKTSVSLDHWERFTGDPLVCDVDNALVHTFRSRMVDAGFAGATINSAWTNLRKIFRRLGPQEYRNPFGLGLLMRIPAMRTVKVERSAPYRIPLDDLSRSYDACTAAGWPRNGIPATDLWRALFVVAYTTGLRRDDLKTLRWDQFDFDRQTVEFSAGKTGKGDRRRLHPTAIQHLERIYRSGEFVFVGLSSRHNGNLYKTLGRIQRTAGVKRRFTLHDLRRTGGSEVERVAKGVGRTFLQHVPDNVSDISYLNRLEEVNEAVLEMRMPGSFVGEPPALELKPIPEFTPAERIAAAETFNRGEWEFRPGAFRLSGQWFPLRSGVSLDVLRTLIESPRPVTSKEIAFAIGRSGISRSRLSGIVAHLREHLKRKLGLPDGLDPVPCVQKKPSAWTVHFPAYVLFRFECNRNAASLPDAGVVS